jgi:hypothetical protein
MKPLYINAVVVFCIASLLRDCNILPRLGTKGDFALVCAGATAQIAMRRVSCLASLTFQIVQHQ